MLTKVVGAYFGGGLDGKQGGSNDDTDYGNIDSKHN